MTGLAINRLRPGIVWRLADEPKNEAEYIEFLEWGGSDAAPTWQEVCVCLEQIKQEFAVKSVKKSRQNAYQSESDPLFFKWQRGEATKDEWLAKVDEIKGRFPYEE